ncbi:MAG: hypothetical protein AUJ28_00690 [Parcubacteria group bacterium CG1_02_37_51]|uniref:Uncharacterized protein n=2 Tax=Candidatus Komeiliibacteriota TaxID=1817908 RepID=A0A2M8DQQ2_9BACT|nr:MAG: hypothetical protein AUJ28_00690 [Parcubacteria group bacterium CG1_02_37_51]PIY93798.1 MAG: hypothetical protein COY67_03530 [Candidatus Komeilibacteria bacterium CG_4_10_14_0_8_um_filter_37_78]PJC01599.1 MAG: hypothetical protein CO073_03270 [Candidatus Komeilibacteria bacterium CG_4_9_14_0_8_um_filter_36_9]
MAELIKMHPTGVRYPAKADCKYFQCSVEITQGNGDFMDTEIDPAQKDELESMFQYGIDVNDDKAKISVCSIHSLALDKFYTALANNNWIVSSELLNETRTGVRLTLEGK